MIHKGGLASKPLQRVIEYINEHLQDELSLFELARTAKLSPHYFATAFKASTGISPHRYVIERRLDRARDLRIRNRHAPKLRAATKRPRTNATISSASVRLNDGQAPCIATARP
jgi:AraC-like DNA-binding protein